MWSDRGQGVPSAQARRADWADTTGWALRRTADGLEVQDEDVARIEEQYASRRSVRPAGSGGAGRGRLMTAIGVVAVVVSVGLSAVALASVRDVGHRAGAVAAVAAVAAQPVAPGGVALAGPADLAGLWRLEDDESWPPLWVIRPDGTFEVLRPRTLLQESPSPGSVLVQAPDRLRVSDASGCVAWFRAERLSLDRLRLHWLTTDPGCRGDLGTGRAWLVSDLVRVAPTPVPVRSRYAGGGPRQLRWESGLDGVWLLQGSARLLGVDARRYAVIDDVTAWSAGGGRRFVERGTVWTGTRGRVELRPTGPPCPRAYRVWTDYATLDARLQETSCGRVGGAADTWVRLM